MQKKKTEIDKKTIESAQKGDMASFEKIVRHYEQRVLALACNILSSPVDARDVAQEVFIRLYTYLPGFRFQNKFYTWLYRIVVNASYDWLRKQRRFRALSLEEVTESFQTGHEQIALDNFDLEEKVKESLNRINHVYKTAFILKEVEGFSCKEIAEIMNCPQGTVRSHLHHARRGLQRELQKHYPELVKRKSGLQC